MPQCHGRVRTEDLNRKITVRGFGGAEFALRDVRRLLRSPDGTLAILYEVAGGPNTPAALKQLLRVPLKNISSGDVADVVFQVGDPHGTCPAGSQFHLSAVAHRLRGVRL